jgi:hypothetical protein
MTMKRLTGLILLVVLGFVAGYVADYNPEVEIEAQEPVVITAQVKDNPITILQDIVNSKSIELQNTKYFEHTNLDGCDYNCRVTKADPLHEYHYGEVLYHGKCDIRTAAVAWDASPTHKAILDKDFEYGSMDIVPSGDGLCYIILNIIEK